MESFKSLLVNNSLLIMKYFRLVVVRHLLAMQSKIGQQRAVPMSQSTGENDLRRKERVQREKRNIRVQNL
jgi:hypothetical protein